MALSNQNNVRALNMTDYSHSSIAKKILKKDRDDKINGFCRRPLIHNITSLIPWNLKRALYASRIQIKTAFDLLLNCFNDDVFESKLLI